MVEGDGDQALTAKPSFHCEQSGGGVERAAVVVLFSVRSAVRRVMPVRS